MTDAVTLIIKGCQGEPGELVAEAALGDAASRHGGQRHEALVRLPRPLSSQPRHRMAAWRSAWQSG